MQVAPCILSCRGQTRAGFDCVILGLGALGGIPPRWCTTLPVLAPVVQPTGTSQLVQPNAVPYGMRAQQQEISAPQILAAAPRRTTRSNILYLFYLFPSQKHKHTHTHTHTHATPDFTLSRCKTKCKSHHERTRSVN